MTNYRRPTDPSRYVTVVSNRTQCQHGFDIGMCVQCYPLPTRAASDVGGVVDDSNMNSTALKRAKADAWDEGREAMGDDIQRSMWDGDDDRTPNPYREVPHD